MGWEQARQCRPELTVWAGSVEASKAIDHALDQQSEMSIGTIDGESQVQSKRMCDEKYGADDR